MKKTIEIAFYRLECGYMGEMELDHVMSTAYEWFTRGLTSGIELEDYHVYFKEVDSEIMNSIDGEKLNDIFCNWYEESTEDGIYNGFEEIIITTPYGHFS